MEFWRKGETKQRGKERGKEGESEGGSKGRREKRRKKWRLWVNGFFAHAFFKAFLYLCASQSK